MAKKEIKNNDSQKKIIFIVGVIIFIAAILLVINLIPKSNDNQSSGLALDDFYSSDSCRCLERQRPACSLEGFEYNGTRNLCVNDAEKKGTSPIFACSSYECSGVNYQHNSDNEKWEVAN